jgi:hypothetical protein
VGNIGSIIGCILYVQFYEHFTEYGQFLLLVTFLYTVFCSFLGNEIESLNRKVNTMLFDSLYSSIKSSGKERTGVVISAALFVQFISSLVFIILAILVGEIILDFLHEAVVNISIEVWQYGRVAILGSGIGMLATVFKDKKSKRIVSVLSLVFLLIIISI